MVRSPCPFGSRRGRYRGAAGPIRGRGQEVGSGWCWLPVGGVADASKRSLLTSPGSAICDNRGSTSERREKACVAACVRSPCGPQSSGRADPRLSQWKANPWWPRRQGILFLVRARSLSEFPGAALGVSRLARSSSVSGFVAGKLPPVLSAYPGCLSGRCIRLLILRFPSRVRVPPGLADYSCLLTRSAPGVCRCGRLWPAVNLVRATVFLRCSGVFSPLNFLELTVRLHRVQELFFVRGSYLGAVHIEGVGKG